MSRWLTSASPHATSAAISAAERIRWLGDIAGGGAVGSSGDGGGSGAASSAGISVAAAMGAFASTLDKTLWMRSPRTTKNPPTPKRHSRIETTSLRLALCALSRELWSPRHSLLIPTPPLLPFPLERAFDHLGFGS